MREKQYFIVRTDSLPTLDKFAKMFPRHVLQIQNEFFLQAQSNISGDMTLIVVPKGEKLSKEANDLLKGVSPMDAVSAKELLNEEGTWSNHKQEKKQREDALERVSGKKVDGSLGVIELEDIDEHETEGLLIEQGVENSKVLDIKSSIESEKDRRNIPRKKKKSKGKKKKKTSKRG